MKANELRIGSLVYITDTSTLLFYKQVTQINIHNLMYLCGETKESFEFEIEPIPLTEDWLLKFGFTHTHNTPHPNRVFMKSWTEGYFKLEEIINYFWGGSDYSVELEYVHQLQNLYFALTNEELI
jgi:hypothetical protein